MRRNEAIDRLATAAVEEIRSMSGHYGFLRATLHPLFLAKYAAMDEEALVNSCVETLGPDVAADVEFDTERPAAPPSRRELATLLAALRHYQATGGLTAPGIEDVATGGGEFAPLDQKEIDALCERLNFDDVGDEGFSSMAARLARRDRKPGDESYVSAAQARSRDGELEVDQGAYVSRMNEGADGAFVMAWLWVSDDEAGLSRCAECGEAYSVGGDGYDGRCPDCADARENEG